MSKHIMLTKDLKWAIAGLSLLFTPAIAIAQSATTATVFYVATSGRTGHVNYDIKLNSNCSPNTTNPVYNYYQKQDGSTRQLDQMEQDGYNITHQSVSGNSVTLTLATLQHYGIESPITITSSKLSNGRCQTQALLPINGTSTPLDHIDVEVNRRQFLGQTVGVQILTISLIGANQQREAIPCHTNCHYGL